MSPRRIEIKDPLLRVLAPFLLSLLLFGYEIHAISTLAQVARWPRTPGRVLTSDVRRPLQNGSLYLRYRYVVDGTPYTSRRLSYGRLSLIPFVGERASAIVRRYPEGRDVTVRFDPDRPSRAVLETDAPFALFLNVGLSMFLVIVTGANTIGAIRRRWRAVQSGESFFLPEQRGLFAFTLAGIGLAYLWVWTVVQYL